MHQPFTEGGWLVPSMVLQDLNGFGEYFGLFVHVYTYISEFCIA